MKDKHRERESILIFRGRAALGGHALLASMLVASCSGTVPKAQDERQAPRVDDETPYEPPETIDAQPSCRVQPGAQPLRRLTNREYDLSVRALFPNVSLPAFAEMLPGDNLKHHLDNNEAVQTVIAERTEGYVYATEAISTAATANLGDLTGCGEPLDQGCVQDYLATLAERAFRRPLLDGERDRVTATYDRLLPATTPRVALQGALEQILQSPQFVYHTEALAADEAEPSSQLGAYALAARLSYMLWSTLPDDELYEAAKTKSLLSQEGLAVQVNRMLEDERGRRGLMHLASQWLGYEAVLDVIKNEEDFPEFTTELVEDMRKETEAFVEHVFMGRAPFSDLYTASYGFRSEAVSNFLDHQEGGSRDLREIELDEARSAGVLSHPSLLTLNATSRHSSPIYRGRLVREGLLCDELPLPSFAIPDVPEIGGDVTVRDAHAQHSSDPACQGCHRLVDPLGFGFENFDAVGRWRDAYDNGREVDASGEIIAAGLEEEDEPFVGIRELGERLARSSKAHRCVATQLVRYALGRDEDEQVDACAIDRIAYALKNEGKPFTEVVRDFVTSDAFTAIPEEP